MADILMSGKISLIRYNSLSNVWSINECGRLTGYSLVLVRTSYWCWEIVAS